MTDMMELSELFFSSSPSEIASGYARDPSNRNFVCLVCGCRAEAGRIYRLGDDYFEAERFIREHVASSHGSILDYLLGLDKKLTGITDQQGELMRRFARGDEDKKIAADLGIAASTVRNHRFALRERAKQARIFLAAMHNLERNLPEGDRFMTIRRSATMVDERYRVTEGERADILAKYFVDEKLTEFPSKQKRKLVVLDRLAKAFEAGRRYTEKQVNEILLEFYGDYATIRRYLVEYGFMDREPDGSAYWVKE
jgi:hypothetical protein